MKPSLTGRKIVLTGCSRGVGLASARLLLEQGAEVLGVSREPSRLENVSAQLRELGAFHPVCADVSSAESAELLRERADQLLGHIDILINNAGVMLHHEAEISQEPPGILEASLETNLLAPLRVSRALLPLLERSPEPRIIHVSSGAGTFEGMSEPGIAAYRLSKWALNGLTLLQAKELTGRVTVNAFDPGWVRTDLGGPKAPGTPEEAAEGLLKSLLLPPTTHGKFLKDGKVISW